MTEASAGLIIKAHSGLFTVRDETGDHLCRLRGRLKKVRKLTDLATVGDEVRLEHLPDGACVIVEVLPRRTVISRRAPGGGGRAGRRRDSVEREQVILANPDQAVLVFAAAQPAPRLGMLDRFLVIAEASKLPAVICANKIDVAGEAEARAIFGLYETLGYRVIYTSALTGLGVDVLRDQLQGRISALSGPSGVGKSSLLNAIQPGLGLAVREVSQITSKGRHTTVASELVPLAAGGWVADTPGMRALEPWDLETEELDGYFVELRRLVGQCEFGDCTHLREPGCAVRAAVERGDVARSRYESYVKLYTDSLAGR